MHNYHARALAAPFTLTFEYSHSLHTWPARPMNITIIRVFSEIENRFESARIICAPTKQTFQAAIYSLQWQRRQQRQRAGGACFATVFHRITKF